MENTIAYVRTIVLFCLTFALWLSPAVSSPEPLVVYGDQRLPPYEFLEGGVPKGINIDLWEAIGRKLGRPVDIRLMDWADAQDQHRSDKKSFLSAMSRTPERETVYRFSQMIHRYDYSYFVRSDAANAFEDGPMEQHRIGVVTRGLPRLYFENEYPQLTLVVVQDTAEGMRRLLRGDIDAFATSTQTGQYFLKELGIRGVVPLPRPFVSKDASFAIRREHAERMDEIDRAITELKNEGAFDRILDRWAGKRVHVISEQEVWNIGWTALAALSVFAAVVLLVRLYNRQHLLAEKRAEQAIRDSEEKYRTLFSNMTEGFVLAELMYDDQGRPVSFVFLETNEAFYEQTGLPHSVVGKHSRDVLSGVNQGCLDIFHSVVTTGQSVRFQEFNADTERYYDFCAFRASSECFAFVLRDITKVKEAEEQLQEREKRFRGIFEQAAVGLAYISLEGRPTQCNDKFCSILGYNRDEIDQLTFRDTTHPDDLPVEFEKAALIMSGAIDSCSLEKRYIRKDGSVVWANLTLSLARKENGEPDYLVAVVEDIQQRKEAEQALSEERQVRHTLLEKEVAARTAELEAANRELERFAYATSHDLRGPLGRINSFSQMLEQRYRAQLEGDGLAYLDFIRQNATRLSSLVDDLMSHIVVAQSEVQLQPLSVLACTKRALREKQHELLQKGADVVLEIEPAVVLSDQFSLNQALSNLIDNAIKYSDKTAPLKIEIGGKTIGEHYRLWVRDNGIGFDMAYHDKVFEMFGRLHTYNEYQGSGVGLALVKRAMERMGGLAWAESAPGQGSTFYLEMQAVKAADSALDRELPTSKIS